MCITAKYPGKCGGDAMVARDISAIIDEAKYRYYGLRVASKISDHYTPDYVRAVGWTVRKNLRVGQRAPQSHVWVDGNPRARRLPGTSAIRVGDPYDHVLTCARLLGAGPARRPGAGGYLGDQIVLLGSDYVADGQDNDEIIMSDAIVLATWHRAAFLEAFTHPASDPPSAETPGE